MSGFVRATKGRGPFELIYYEACKNELDAFSREKYLKSGPGKHYLNNRLKRFLSLVGILFIFLYSHDASAGLILNHPNYTGLNSGLVGYWSFDGKDMANITAYDRSGQNNNGTLTGGPTRAIGKLGQALNFDGVDDFVNAGAGSSLTDIFNTGGTISAWVYPKNIPTTWGGHIVSKIDGAGPPTVGMTFVLCNNWVIGGCSGQTNNLLFSREASQNGIWRSPANSISLNTWQHVAVTYSDVSPTTAPILFINGVQQNITLIQSLIAPVGGDASIDLIIGKSGNAGFNGLIDDVRVYNRALSADEIKRLYRIGATLKINTSINNDSLQKGLVGYWTFDGKDMAGNTAYDRSGNSNNGTLTNGPKRAIGKIGQALEFNDEASQRVHMSSAPVTAVPLTICAWFYDDEGDVIFNDRNIAQIGDSDTTSNYFRLSKNDDAKNAQIVHTDGIGNAFAPTTNTYNINTWNHACAIFYTSTHREVVLNADFANKGVDATTAATPVGVKVMDIGYEGDSTPGDAWSGRLDEVRVYNRALTRDEIKRLYSLGR